MFISINNFLTIIIPIKIRIGYIKIKDKDKKCL